MSESQHRALSQPDMDAAEFAPAGIDGRNGGMSLKEIARRLTAFLKSPKRQSKDQAHFGWLTLKQKQAALKREARRIELQSAQQHPRKTGVRKFRVRCNDPWKKL